MTSVRATTPAAGNDENRVWRLLGFGAGLTALGLGIAGTVAPGPGGAVCLAGWLMLLVGLHRGGRLGRRSTG